MPGYFALAPRPIAPEDAAGAHQLLVLRLGVTPYIDRAIEILTLAERGDDPEHRAYVVARDKTVAGLALFGSIAGTESGFKLHSLVVELPREGDVGERLLAAVASAIGASGGRFVIAELADEPALTTTIGLLRDQGFAEVGRIPDYYRDGVALTILRRDL
jgi:ribosomal protein S18 acetylase RimI-like enzyme